MQYSQYVLFSDGGVPQDDLPIDELDTLFEQLPQLEVSPSLIARILATISRLPRPTLCIPKEELGDNPNHPSSV